MSNSLTHEVLTENLNTRFQLAADDTNTVELELIEVSELKLHDTQEQFGILFRGPRDRFLEQGMRSLDHEKLGKSDLFLVPIREDAEGYYYEAVFNRWRK